MSQVTKPIALDETLQGVAKDTTLERIAEALDAKDTTQQRISEINAAGEEKKQEIDIVGEQVKAAIPDDYSTLSKKVNNTSNALKGIASGEAVAITDVSSNEHTMGVKVRSKNLFDKNNYNVGYRVKNTDGTLSQSTTGYSSTDYIPVVGGKTYIVSGYVTDDSTTRHIAYYDSNKVFVSGGSVTDIFTAPTNAAYMRKSLHEDDVETYQIEEGDTATPYTPYVADVSTVSVSKLGKNILPSVTKPTDNYGLTFTKNEDSTITVNGTANADWQSYIYNKEIYVGNKTITISGLPAGGSLSTWFFSVKYNGNKWADITNFKTVDNVEVINGVILKIYSGTQCSNLTFKPQIEVGNTATEYEPYKESVSYTPGADGTVEEVTSLYPVTTLLTDTAGVIVDCEYNRDINKVYEELVNAIVSLGGNV